MPPTHQHAGYDEGRGHLDAPADDMEERSRVTALLTTAVLGPPALAGLLLVVGMPAAKAIFATLIVISTAVAMSDLGRWVTSARGRQHTPPIETRSDTSRGKPL